MAELIEITTPDGTAEAYLARPAGESRGGVLFYMDAIGLRPRIADMVDTIAGWGYTVLAPNVFYRTGTAAETSPTADLRDPEARAAFFASGVMDRVNGLTPDQIAIDVPAYAAVLEEYAGAGPIGATGYCMGARIAVRTAGLLPDKVAAVGGFHGGGLVTDDPASPHTAIAGTRAEYVFGHADSDGSMTPENVAALGETLQAAGVAYRNEIYPGAAHGYTMEDTSQWNAQACERHFAELRDVLDRTLGAS
ncbi:dienelactone hydrolase family protein [Nocardioides sp. DS6]|uniref:Dienelactone hydrolase family protein n=1 Tax=Nocardioides eburneus TaxID=3231482 RepID=A0ABV3T367_9ACTN